MCRSGEDLTQDAPARRLGAWPATGIQEKLGMGFWRPPGAEPWITASAGKMLKREHGEGPGT